MLFFFFKQKTAYEMRISDWSSDVSLPILRLANDARSSFRWVVGANYEHSRVREDDEVNYADSTSSYVNTQVIGQDYDQAGYNNRQRLKNYAVFGNVEYDISDQLTLKGGIRYTEAKRSSVNKTFDLGDGSISSLFTTVINTYRQIFDFGGPIPLVPLGDSVSLNSQTGLPGSFRDKLNENSTSWMLGVNYKATPTLLLYANVSKGYKAGSFPGVSAGTFAQYAAVTQESLVDYEAGFKTTLFDRKVTLNGGVFYYDYKNKQLRAKIVDPFFNALDGLVNVPKSRVKGAELELSARVVEGLTVSAAATYIDAKVRHYQGIVGSVANEVGLFDPIRGDFSGALLPFSPKWQSSLSADCSLPLGGVNLTMGTTIRSQSKPLRALAITNRENHNYDATCRTPVSPPLCR